MYSVCINCCCKFNIIINYKRNMIFTAKLLDFFCLFHEMFFIQILFAQLDKCCPTLQYFFNLTVKCLSI